MKGHRGHAYCGRLCCPQWLYDEFQSILGPRSGEFDVLTWLPKQDAEFAHSYGLIEEPITAWRDAFRAELAVKGWTQPKKRPVYQNAKPDGPPGWRPVNEMQSIGCRHEPQCQTMKAHIMRIVNDGRRERGAEILPNSEPPDPEERPEDWWQR